ncbi:TPA: type VI secretion system tube protein Hcp [Escherichia coli]|mgnify:CR=1 FL=1|nr:type VI secretion system tube protein Hcp [Escherichia coli]EEW1657206.1 type VI secretion system tube protein Hcp [Escherichia coli]EFA7438876.1 type VI secretion system tube protein Hcp [Escherichia coli]EFA7442993.1 type VI secretion system tube protein Hcp [Escherichia coli]EFA7462691.1 type VI secretion system tube protein Hcp [Escherichia coli]
MPTPCYISITGQTQGNITAGAFTADSVGNIYVQGHEDEMLPTTELHWWRTSVEGKQEHYFTTRLTDSTIVDMKLHMPHCQDPAKREFTQLLEVSLAYRKIEWEHVKSGTSGADDWRAPLEA